MSVSGSSALSELTANLDTLATVDLHAVPVAELPGLLEQLTVLQRRLDAAVLRTVAVFDSAQAFSLDGASSAKAWMRANLRHTPGAARAAVSTARRLRDLPTMTAAFEAGQISREHLAVVTRAMEATPARQASIAAAEPTFCQAAIELDPHQLSRAVTRWTHTVDPLTAVEHEVAVHAQRYLSISRTFEGAVRIDGLLAPEAGATVMTALEAMTTADYRQQRGGRGDGHLADLTPGQRRADSLVSLARRFLDSGTAPEIAGARPHLQLTVPLHTLSAKPGQSGVEPGELDGVGPISAEAARRIGCDALLTAMGLDVRGTPLTLGRSQRTVDARLRTVLTTRDRGCRFPGCDRPAAWTQAHHILFWAHGGSTDPTNLVLVCLFHHHLCHEGGFTISGSPQDGTLTFHRPDGTALTDHARERDHPRERNHPRERDHGHDP